MNTTTYVVVTVHDISKWEISYRITGFAAVLIVEQIFLLAGH